MQCNKHKLARDNCIIINSINMFGVTIAGWLKDDKNKYLYIHVIRLNDGMNKNETVQVKLCVNIITPVQNFKVNNLTQ